MVDLAEYFGWKQISTGKILKTHVQERGPHANRIQECIDNFAFVDDDIVIDLIGKEIQTHEKKNNSWIIEGFPRTKVQALSL